MSLYVKTQPVAEPVTLDEVKARLRISNTADDNVILQHITTARMFAERVTNKSLVSKEYTLSLPNFPWPHRPLVLPMPPVSAVTSITFLDGANELQTWDPADYIVGKAQIPAVVVPANGYVYPATLCREGVDAVFVSFVAGPSDDAIQLDLAENLEGIRQLAAHFYEHPSAVTSENLKEMPLGIQALLRARKVYGF